MLLRTKKPWLIPLCLFIYTTVMFIWLLPKNQEASDMEKILTVVVAYAIIGGLYLLLRKKDKLAKERENDIHQNESKDINHI